jgi:hypothetical protein
MTRHRIASAVFAAATLALFAAAAPSHATGLATCQSGGQDG